MRLQGKKVLITGGTSGIGLATARLFLDEGAEVALIGRSPAKLATALSSLGPGAHGEATDVASPRGLATAIECLAGKLGGIDVLMANAGISDAPSIEKTTEADFDALMGVNLKGVIFTVVHALPFLSNGASVLLTGSVAAGKGRPGDPLYAASKGAVRSFGRTLAMDESMLARRIRVNVLTLGATVTPLTQAATDDPTVRDYVAQMVPMGRWGEPTEAAQAALFLASDASSYTTGAEITVDGGLAHV